MDPLLQAMLPYFVKEIWAWLPRSAVGSSTVAAEGMLDWGPSTPLGGRRMPTVTAEGMLGATLCMLRACGSDR